MAFGKEEAALIFQIKADAKDAINALGVTDERVTKLASGFGAATQALGPFGVALGIATAGFTALASAAAVTGAAIFDLAQKTADYGSNIKDAADKTGVSTEALSALKVAADQSGSSLEEVANATVKFSKLIGDAALGSKEAIDSLKRLGVEPQQAFDDLDGALERVFQRILDAPSAVEQTKLAIEAFGRSGANIIPVIKSFDGDMTGLIKRAKELGVVFDQEAADAADEFGDSLDDLSLAVKGLGMVIGREVIPDITRAIKNLTEIIKDNHTAFKTWVEYGVYGVKLWANAYVAQLELVIAPLRLIKGLYTDIKNLDPGFTASRGAAEQSRTNLDFTPKPAVSGGGQADTVDARRSEKIAVDIAARQFKEAEAAAKRAEASAAATEASAKKDSAALLNIWKNYAASIVKTYTEAFSTLKEQFDQSGDADAFKEKLGLLNNLFTQETEKTVANLNAIENAQAEADKKTANERLLLKQEQAAREEEFAQRVTDTWDEAEKLITARLKKETVEREKLTEERFRRELEMARSNAELAIAWAESDREKGLISEIDFQKRLAIEKESVLLAEKRLLQQREQTAEVLQRLRILENELTIQTLQDVDAISKAVQDLNPEIGGAPANTAADTLEGGDSGGPFDGWTESWKGFFESVLGGAPTIASTIGEIGKILQESFQQMAQAIGQVVQNWVLYGETGPAVMRKILASALASIAAESAVRAIYATAYGFLMLAMHDYSAAAAAFQSAAVFGSVAVGAALAGRAIAGDAFKQTAAGGSASSSASSGSRGFTGGAYSGSEPMTVNGGRNAPAGAAGAIVIRDRSSGLFSQLFKAEWENNGPMRRMLVEEFG